MKKDIFSGLRYDVIDDVSFDVLDQVELDPEDKILYSDELKSLLEDAVNKQIAKLPIGKIISEAVSLQVSKQLEKKDYPTYIEKTIDRTEGKLGKEIQSTKSDLKNELERLSKEIKSKYMEFRNILNSQEKYTFGGFAPPNPLGHTGEFLQSSDGTWAGLMWAAAGGGSGGNPLYIGDANTNGSWRFRNDGTDLQVEVRIAGVWTFTGAFQRP